MNDSRPPRGFRRFRAKAEKMASDPKAVAELLDSAANKAKVGGIERVRADFLDMLRMVKAYFRGDYRKIPWTTILTAVGGMLYFVNPFDVIPDFIVGAGYLDDATVLAFCLKSIRVDIQEFLSWETNRPS